MLIFLILAVFSLFSLSFIFAPLFLLAYLLICRSGWLVLALVIAGLAIDLFWVWPLGFSTLGLGLFVLIIYLYSQKFSYYNQLFLFVLLALSSLLVLRIFRQPLSVFEAFIFSFLFFWLNVQLHQVRVQSLKNI
ncbi:hypothetical protein A2313_00095 [Candidatus Roizmanbacteria bacterium RIFOXYB2_FULL_41_10]|uniref:Rod shape-determining protein MreD n=1 Tax=Candidatus Roizmanbacteria bacterium RIFOXYA1_FULL_41_12 TaxID=1802082 RepID=A0A1F7KAS2_9BACT|nr:MAG: hypothetical protein A2209_04625 [Candidatus Roizmanbacteria bacterium RIFOXYA1_FULL_41_12]OGK66790.1 MAG: hypothetical protein A2377_02700 [Candidatus Roizmanbacteria bacterium RIFOXYB1_FULL_41_27]OGK68038.1 MAG: hypothetical protein A2262_00250 [Candidatus Roizmanbacteria bacterium RIFOXYA2_FULL_41_8]OGK70836.1 MAG: hypothetical protein A2403_02005 [Candidatus Roizmanbacteria bacterium RIFOXYC1_FULL_41_16]OGK71373.1 MAG: hypothetical protein A2313_00095 [Candidatus Roizmanbacteria bac